MKKDPTGAISFRGESDLPPMAVSMGTMAFNVTGAWKSVEPFYADKTPPCNALCPAGEDIVIYLALAYEGRYDEALRILRNSNPFPAILGRVCPHPCEIACNRVHVGGAIAISKVERFLGDYALAQGIRFERLGEFPDKVAVIGSGPAGLSAAYYLAVRGYDVTVFERDTVVGGLLRTGIPPFRLPRDVLDAELRLLEDLPIRFEMGKALGRDLRLDALRNEYAAVVVAIGRYASRSMAVKGEDLPGVVRGIDLLHQVHTGAPMQLGRRVAVIGGGNTALDCVRTLRRLGHDACVVYRRTLSEMPAFPEDIEEADEEGIGFRFLEAPVRVEGAGKVERLILQKMRLGDPDASGRCRPAPIEGSEFTMEVDVVVTALGEMLEEEVVSGLDVAGGGVRVAEHLATSIDGVFSAGDCVDGAGTVTAAIGAGRKAAAAVHGFLRGEAPEVLAPAEARGASTVVAEWERLNEAHLRSEPMPIRERLPGRERLAHFREINVPFEESVVRGEAGRCLACGTCTLCDTCRTFCADAAIHTRADGTGYDIDYDHCKGCGVCVEECPRDAMSMRPVQQEGAS